jgi:hypothetical protein
VIGDRPGGEAVLLAGAAEVSGEPGVVDAIDALKPGAGKSGRAVTMISFRSASA